MCIFLDIQKIVIPLLPLPSPPQLGVMCFFWFLCYIDMIPCTHMTDILVMMQVSVAYSSSWSSFVLGSLGCI